MKLHKIDHIGVVVNDFSTAKAFFLDLGFKAQGEGEVEGEWVDQVIGLDHAKVTYLMLSTPDGGSNIELIKFHAPLEQREVQIPFANTPGIRHIAFVIEDIEAVVGKLKSRGAEMVGKITNIGSFKLCYIRGPEGIIVELAEQLSSPR
jgi:catechol 2,3-dioxygenase-like lactoylglutathione lyase family enzyme